MGLSTAAATGVIVVALLISFSTIFIQLSRTLQDVKEEAVESSEELLEEGQTKFLIKSISYNRTSNNTTVKLRNTGSTVLNTNELNVLNEGEVIPCNNISYSVSGNDGDMWSPDSYLEITLKNINLDYEEESSGIKSKIDVGSPIPESLTKNAYYTYIQDNGDILIYDHDNNFIDNVSDGELTNAEDISSSSTNLYAIDGSDHVDRFDLTADKGTKLISGGGELTKPKSISVTDENPDDYIYILDDNKHIDKYDLDGNYISTPVSGLDGAIDVYVTDHIYIVNSTAGVIEKFDLDGTNPTTIIDDEELNSPTNITVSDKDFKNEYIYIIDSEKHIDVFSADGTFVDTIEDGLSNDLAGIDIGGELQVGNGLNGWNRISIGCQIKVVDENGVPVYGTI